MACNETLAKAQNLSPLVPDFNLPAIVVSDIAFYGDTEPESIFMVCEWILSQTKK